jgi:hypothetical protein
MGNYFSFSFEGHKKYISLLLVGSIIYFIIHTISVSYYVKSDNNSLLKDQKEVKNATISSLVFSIVFLVFNSFLLIKNRNEGNDLFQTNLLDKITKWTLILSLIIFPLLFIIYDAIIINKINKEGDKIAKQDTTYKSMVILNALLTYIQIILFGVILYRTKKQTTVNKDLCRNYEVDIYYLTSNLEDREIE